MFLQSRPMCAPDLGHISNFVLNKGGYKGTLWTQYSGMCFIIGGEVALQMY